MDRIESWLYDWCDDAAGSRLEEVRAVRKMMERNHDDIVNYFLEGHINGKAENMNGKIQRFLSNNFVIKERVFFPTQIGGLFFLAPQKNISSYLSSHFQLIFLSLY